ncbi:MULTISPECIES: glycosyltransferase family 2 protein [Streptomyces]|uniref:glycosyltransferase family 2 protein n=1 Tax=Streptomyces TaxID=1883 RepID=UPI0022488A95|nr:glycosyltransferase [Streptomyces sp. JHD 1]MCX2970689.1 glycosyltransferase [Streptomyces sp. JHD 1]
MATRNRADRLARTLTRLTALPERPQVIVVDNASTDHTRALVAERFPGVRVLTLKRNAGAAARTVGAATLDTPVVAFSDDDSWWAPGALDRAAALLRAYPRLGLVVAATRVGADGVPDPLNAVLADSPLGRPPDLPGPEVLGFLGCAAVARRAAFLDAGGYHPLLCIGGEETLLAWDLAARGWGISYCPEVTAWHDPDDGPRPERPMMLRRNEVLSCWLRRPLPRALRRTAALAAAARTDPVARRALGEVLSALPAALRERRTLPPWTERTVRRLEGAAPHDER